ncbi:protein DpdE [Streptomyces polygonati]|uniref:Protein DpdE n=1 Tax=Streptomyces polygonati TaxID=1617087 RepID=A0ABV8HUY2_9ACTN
MLANRQVEAVRRMASEFQVGNLVQFTGAPGVGRVGAVEGSSLRIDYFESIVEQVVDSRVVSAKSCRRARLEAETRVYWFDASTGDWLTGRVQADRFPEYFVHFPNEKWVCRIQERELRVRWDRPVRDPLQVLATGGNESGYFRDARQPLLRELVAQRAASASTAALLSSAVEIYPHQIRAAMTVLSDPVQRYLLADEVGLGKSIEAGYVIRQTLLDNPHARVTVLAPGPLRRQWDRELRDRFFIDDFPAARVVITSHDTPEKWKAYHGSDLAVVDEAHALVKGGDEAATPYRELAALAHSAPRLLLLSATPVTSQHTTYLGLLHLLDPDLYSWHDREAFERRYELRSELADCAYSLDATFTFLLGSTLDDIRRLLPEDPRFEDLAARVVACLTQDDELREEVEPAELAVRVEELRGHISETYRLHRRVIRHRRAQVLVEAEDSPSEPYAVRGRARPDVLVGPSHADSTQEALQDWRTCVWSYLLDSGFEQQAANYGLTLGVLASRTGAAAMDFVDALRWRLRSDADAAERAGLSALERAALTTAHVVEAEQEVLADVESQLAATDSDLQLKGVVHTLLPVFKLGGRIVIFCGPGVLAHQLVQRLHTQFPTESVAEHTRQAGVEASEQAVVAWRSSNGRASILVVDDTAEDGLNLQVADAAIHLRMPWSPNQLEQRIGRVDRYRGTESVRQSSPARQYVLGLGEEHEALSTQWLSLLCDGYGVFSTSVSTLQDAIAENLATVWSSALREGPVGLAAAIDEVRSDLLDARKQIEKMDMLDSIYEGAEDELDVSAALRELEGDWPSTRTAILAYTGHGAGGISLHHARRTVDGCALDVFDLAASRPHVAPRLYLSQSASIGTSPVQGVFNRSTALRFPGARLFRIGNPFVDMLASLAAIDDRGQATAFQRIDTGYQGDPAPYFGFDFLVEADITPAVAAASLDDTAALALRRQADQLLPPFSLKVWVPAGAPKALTSSAACAWLDMPYDNRRDQNYNPQQIRHLVRIFGGWPSYRGSAQAAVQTARDELHRVTDLSTHCARAQEQAARRLSVQRAQAQARRAAGRLLGDTESYVLDVDLADRLVEGLARPTVRLAAATCVVRSRPGKRRGDA